MKKTYKITLPKGAKVYTIDRMEETTEVFFGREHKPQATKAYKTK